MAFFSLIVFKQFLSVKEVKLQPWWASRPGNAKLQPEYVQVQ